MSNSLSRESNGIKQPTRHFNQPKQNFTEQKTPPAIENSHMPFDNNVVPPKPNEIQSDSSVKPNQSTTETLSKAEVEEKLTLSETNSTTSSPGNLHALLQSIEKQRTVQIELKKTIEDMFSDTLVTNIQYVKGKAPLLTSKVTNTPYQLTYDLSDNKTEVILEILDTHTNESVEKPFNNLATMVQYLYYVVHGLLQ